MLTPIVAEVHTVLMASGFDVAAAPNRITRCFQVGFDRPGTFHTSCAL